MKKEKDIVCDCEAIHADIVNEVKERMPLDEDIYDLSDFFKVLGDSTRMRIIWALDESEMCVCDIAVLLNMTKSAISHQLRALRNANLVKFRKEGKTVFYSLKDDHVRDIYEIGMEHIREKYLGGQNEKSI
ncbi:MAG: winged helix-turn-helix transcriptional regulator [Tissierellia bacterium]|nr:winged helix-turn-helix transcriptional regulator [Tissierellia bacterium]